MPDIFEKLQELILDENKVVTYKTLCRTLHVPANKAKQYLSDFFDKYAATHDLSASYMLIGLSSIKKGSQQCTRIAVVSSQELEKMKKEFSSISSMHVYAVHKGKLLDENILFNTDYEKMDRVEDYNRFSCIRNPNIYVQAEQQVKPVFILKDTGVSWKPNLPSNQTAQKNETRKAPANKSKAPNLFSMFQKKNEDEKNQPKVDDTAQTNQESPSKNKKPSPVQSKSSKGSGSTKNDVKYFFAKQAEKPPKSQIKKEEPAANLDAPSQKEKESSKAVKELKSSPEINKSSASRHSSKRAKSEKSKPSRSKAKRMNANDSDEDFKPVKKKHKRIVTIESDSESENEQEIDRAQRELFESHPATSATVAAIDSDEDIIPPTQPVTNGKKKKWKVMTKTYEDEDGFFVTKKEKELVTDSDEDDSGNPSKAPMCVKKKESPKMSPTKKKQSSLMNFFKQK